jgi:predicted phosphodiesterase
VAIVPGSIQVRAWDANTGDGIQRLKYYRATLEPVSETKAQDEQVERLCAQIAKRKPAKPAPPSDTARAFVILASDWQLGKSEGGGSEVTATRIMDSIDRAVVRFKELKKLGRPCRSIYLVGLGDLVEQCSGHYAIQAFSVDLDRRQQMKLARSLLMYAVDQLVSLGVPVILGAVPGNHGENRNASGKAYTTWTDNDDLAVFETVMEILTHNPERYANVAFPNCLIAEDLSMILDIEGVPCGFIHGHQARSGANAQQKMEKWLTGQIAGRQPISDAEILFAGHLHHLVISEAVGRTVIQVPAMDGGSHWWTSMTGQHAPAGMLTLCVGSQVGIRGWADLLLV